MAIAEVSIVPIGTATTSLSRYVAEAVNVLKAQKDVKYTLTAMGTIIEGDIDSILGVTRRMHQAVLDAGIARVVTTIKIDDRRDKTATAESKMESVRKAIEEKGGNNQ